MHPSRHRRLIGGFPSVESSLVIILCIASLVILIRLGLSRRFARRVSTYSKSTKCNNISPSSSLNRDQHAWQVIIKELHSSTWISLAFFHSHRESSLPFATDWKSKNNVALTESGAQQVKCLRLQSLSNGRAHQDMDRALELY